MIRTFIKTTAPGVVALALAACHATPAPVPVLVRMVLPDTVASAAKPTTPAAIASLVTRGPARELVTGHLVLPESLVAVGAGTLVGVGAGSLVGVGAGSLVGVGAGSLVGVGAASLVGVGAASARPITGARVLLAFPDGLDADVPAVVTDGEGAYRLVGRAGAGLYRVQAGGASPFMTFVALNRGGQAPTAGIDAATTLVSAGILATGTPTVLPLHAYRHAVDTVAAALPHHTFPAGWTPDQAATTLTQLAAAEPGVASAMNEVADERERLEERLVAMRFQITGLADALGRPVADVEADARAMLSEDGEADAVALERVARDPSPVATPTATPSPTPPAESPAAPTPGPAGGGSGGGSSGGGNTGANPPTLPGIDPQPSPMPSPVATPTPTPSPTPTPTPTPKPTTPPRSLIPVIAPIVDVIMPPWMMPGAPVARPTPTPQRGFDPVTATSPSPNPTR